MYQRQSLLERHAIILRFRVYLLTGSVFLCCYYDDDNYFSEALICKLSFLLSWSNYWVLFSANHCSGNTLFHPKWHQSTLSVMENLKFLNRGLIQIIPTETFPLYLFNLHIISTPQKIKMICIFSDRNLNQNSLHLSLE